MSSGEYLKGSVKVAETGEFYSGSVYPQVVSSYALAIPIQLHDLGL